MAQRLNEPADSEPDGARTTDLQPSEILLGDRRVRAGERQTIDLPVAKLPTGTWLSLPLYVVCGARPGPRLWLTATIHGEELNGLEIIRRVLERIDAREFAGILIAAPVMNVLGFMNQTRTLPDGSDLNRSFPGSSDGSLAERLGDFFMKEVVSQCDYGIDLHSGANNRLNPPQIRADLSDPETRRLGVAFGAPILMDVEASKGSLRSAAVEAGKRVLLFEGGEPLRYNEESLRAGSDGVQRVLHALKMLSTAPKVPQNPTVEVAVDDQWVKAPRCGILRLDVAVQDEVRKNDRLGVVGDVLGENPEEIFAPFDGIVVGITLNPYVAKNGGVLHLAKRVSSR